MRCALASAPTGDTSQCKSAAQPRNIVVSCVAACLADTLAVQIWYWDWHGHQRLTHVSCKCCSSRIGLGLPPLRAGPMVSPFMRRIGHAAGVGAGGGISVITSDDINK